MADGKGLGTEVYIAKISMTYEHSKRTILSIDSVSVLYELSITYIIII